MNKYFKRLLAAMLLLCLYEKAFTQDIGTVVHHRLRYISPHAQTGLLADRSLGKLDPQVFSTNMLSNDNAVEVSRFSGLYFSMETTPVEKQYLLPDPEGIYAGRAIWKYPSDQMPLALMAFRYDYIRPDALTAGLINLASDRTLIPNAPINQILRQDTVFAVGPHHDVVRSDQVTLYFPTIAKNISVGIDTLWIDLETAGRANQLQITIARNPVLLSF